MTLGKIDCFAVTDVGRQRAENEDQFLIADLVKAVRIHTTSLNHDDHVQVTGQSQGHIFLVADGMGNHHAAGRRASTLAVDETINYMVNRLRWSHFGGRAHAGPTRQDLLADLGDALTHCQQRIWNEANSSPNRQGMGTTLTIAVLDWPSLYIIHAGDSRCYVEHHGNLRQMTHDHTRAQDAADAGTVVQNEANLSSSNNALWNVVGGSTPHLQPEVRHVEMSLGDTLLMCTDGLTKHVADEDIARVLGTEITAAEVCGQLVEMANARGGSDNITVVVARFRERTDTPKEFKAEAAILTTRLQPPSPRGGRRRRQAISTAEPPD